MFAYILVTVEKGKEQEIYKELTNFSEISSINILFGEWDLLLKVRIENSESLGTFVLDKIRTISGVQITSTLIVAK